MDMYLYSMHSLMSENLPARICVKNIIEYPTTIESLVLWMAIPGGAYTYRPLGVNLPPAATHCFDFRPPREDLSIASGVVEVYVTGRTGTGIARSNTVTMLASKEAARIPVQKQPLRIYAYSFFNSYGGIYYSDSVPVLEDAEFLVVEKMDGEHAILTKTSDRVEWFKGATAVTVRYRASREVISNIIDMLTANIGQSIVDKSKITTDEYIKLMLLFAEFATKPLGVMSIDYSPDMLEVTYLISGYGLPVKALIPLALAGLAVGTIAYVAYELREIRRGQAELIKAVEETSKKIVEHQTATALELVRALREDVFVVPKAEVEAILTKSLERTKAEIEQISRLHLQNIQALPEKVVTVPLEEKIKYSLAGAGVGALLALILGRR